MNLPQRIRDWLLERRIASVARDMVSILNTQYIGSECYYPYVRYVDLCKTHSRLIAQRSPQQLARMKGMGE